MASTQHSRRIRRAVASACLICAAALVIPLSASAAPGQPSTIGEVTKKLNDLQHKNEYLTEKFNLAQDNVKAKDKAAKAADAAAKTATKQFQAAIRELGVTISADYKGSSFSHAGALLTSRSGQDYIDAMNTLDVISVRRSDVLAQAGRAKTAAATASTKAASLLKQAKQNRDALAKQRADLDKQQKKFTNLLNTLNAQQQATYNARDNAAPAQVSAAVSVAAAKAPSSAAQTAVNFALAQVGKPYVYAASGPDSYDCSGLTMAAYATAGISLPHNAAEQYNYGTHVAENALMPGDLLFFYSPIGHVTIYIGNGMMVSAPQPGEDVKVVSLSSFGSDYVGATRLT